MTLAATTSGETVRLTRVYAASRQEVFDAWTDSQALGQWFGTDSHKCKIEILDVREGGEYRFRMIPVGVDSDCAGNPEEDSVCAGKFVSIAPPERLVMTFSWVENGADIGETLLSIELFEVEGGTELVLTHERLPDQALREAHASGWQGSLDNLQAYLSR